MCSRQKLSTLSRHYVCEAVDGKMREDWIKRDSCWAQNVCYLYFGNVNNNDSGIVLKTSRRWSLFNSGLCTSTNVTSRHDGGRGQCALPRPWQRLLASSVSVPKTSIRTNGQTHARHAKIGCRATMTCDVMLSEWYDCTAQADDSHNESINKVIIFDGVWSTKLFVYDLKCREHGLRCCCSVCRHIVLSNLHTRLTDVIRLTRDQYETLTRAVKI